MPGIGDIAKRVQEKLNKAKGCDVILTEVGTKEKRGKKVDLTEVVAATFDIIADITQSKDPKTSVVSIQGFGNFRTHQRQATKARNPQTGAQFDVPATMRMKFTASKTLKDRLNGVTQKAAKPAKAKAAAK